MVGRLDLTGFEGFIVQYTMYGIMYIPWRKSRPTRYARRQLPRAFGSQCRLSFGVEPIPSVPTANRSTNLERWTTLLSRARSAVMYYISAHGVQTLRAQLAGTESWPLLPGS